jgi:hypothetical protein
VVINSIAYAFLVLLILPTDEKHLYRTSHLGNARAATATLCCLLSFPARPRSALQSHCNGSNRSISHFSINLYLTSDKFLAFKKQRAHAAAQPRYATQRNSRPNECLLLHKTPALSLAALTNTEERDEFSQ